jgi:hypothetical protein
MIIVRVGLGMPGTEAPTFLRSAVPPQFSANDKGGVYPMEVHITRDIEQDGTGQWNEEDQTVHSADA